MDVKGTERHLVLSHIKRVRFSRFAFTSLDVFSAEIALPAVGKQATGTDYLPQPLESRVRNGGLKKRKVHKKALRVLTSWMSHIKALYSPICR